MPLLWVRSRLFAFVVVGTVFCCCSVVHGDDVTVASGRQTPAHTLAVPSSVHVTTDSSVVDQEACYVALQEAMKQTDHNRNNMTLEEYLNFALAYRPDGSFLVDDDDTVVGDHQQGDISSSTAAEKALLFDVQFLLVVHYYSPFYHNNRADNDDRGVGSNKNAGSSETTRSLVGDTTPTVSEHSYLFQVCTQTSNSTLHNQSTDSLQISTETEKEAPTTPAIAPSSSHPTTITTVPEDNVSAPSTTSSTAVPTAAAANGTTLVVPPPPTSMNREEQQGQSTNDNNNNSTTTIIEEEDRRVARIVGPVVVVVIIVVMIIAWYVTRRRRSKNEEDDEENDAAVAVLLLQPPNVAAAVAHNTTTSDDVFEDICFEDKNVVVIVDTAIKITDVSNDCVMTNQLSLKLDQQEGGGVGGTGGGGTENYSWSSSCPSVMSSSGWSSSKDIDSMNITTT